MELKEKTKNRNIIWYRNSTTRYISKENKNTNLKRYMYFNVDSSITLPIYGSNMCPSIDKEDMAYVCVYIFYTHIYHIYYIYRHTHTVERHWGAGNVSRFITVLRFWILERLTSNYRVILGVFSGYQSLSDSQSLKFSPQHKPLGSLGK